MNFTEGSSARMLLAVTYYFAPKSTYIKYNPTQTFVPLNTSVTVYLT